MTGICRIPVEGTQSGGRKNGRTNTTIEAMSDAARTSRGRRDQQGGSAWHDGDDRVEFWKRSGVTEKTRRDIKPDRCRP
ncbi:unnamed protein product [Angiostrongylus costaricensis]|uniref:General stress protein n=1 Tax=Angiostrongylus costaricensis TaxID=334426 RepID=A0A0R3PTE8_ANGCS|nr:unnamed protein product [Angiostrongylus costaricensis]